MPPKAQPAKPAMTIPSRLRLRLVFGDGLKVGPGKADLLQGIAESGSISAAGRSMGMSYKRAWSLVEEMNTAFRAPLVVSSRGGAKGGGASLTETGQKVLTAFRSLEQKLEREGAAEIAAISDLLTDKLDMSKEK